jgi:uncharacterized protein (DUF2267 family)
MDHEAFIDVVSSGAALDRDGAERAARATLQTLAERIDRGEARDLAARLPAEVAPWIATTSPAEAFDVDEFVHRVARREGVDESTAYGHVRAVFDALARAVGPDELEDVAAQLPKDYAALLPRGSDVEVVPADRFLAQVAERADVDLEGARRATAAVLETLAERIAGGEVRDLAGRRPPSPSARTTRPLHPAWRRDQAAGQARPVVAPPQMGPTPRVDTDDPKERQMQTLQDVQTWRGMTMVDADGDKIGTIDQIFLDRQTGQPEFATVKTGLFGLKTSFVPIVDAEMTGDNTVRVPVQKEQVKDAPRVEPDGQELSPDEERRLWEHYGRGDYDEWHGDDQTTDMDLAEDRPAVVGVRLRRYVVVVPTDRR